MFMLNWTIEQKKDHCICLIRYVHIMGSKRCMAYLHMVRQSVDKFKPWDPSVTAHHTHILCVLTIWHADSIRVAQCQALLFASALDIVKPNASWKSKRNTLRIHHDSYQIQCHVCDFIWSAYDVRRLQYVNPNVDIFSAWSSFHYKIYYYWYIFQESKSMHGGTKLASVVFKLTVAL